MLIAALFDIRGVVVGSTMVPVVAFTTETITTVNDIQC